MSGDHVVLSGNPWTAQRKPVPGAATRLFCLPYAGGSASVFRSWAAAFPSSIEVCAVEWPGRSRRWQEPPFRDLPALVAAMAPALEGHFDLPFAVFGHSLGALAAFELTRHLRRHGAVMPLALFVSGCNAPQGPPASDPIANLPDAGLLDRLRALGGMAPELLAQPELTAFYLPLLRADLGMAETYQYRREAPLECPITVFAGTRDPETDRESVGAWREQTNGLFTLCELAADHFPIHACERELTATIARHLSRAARLRSSNDVPEAQIASDSSAASFRSRVTDRRISS